jgi:HD-like signal output (HDOD) protein
MTLSLQSDLTIDALLKGDLHLTTPPNLFFELKKVFEDTNKSLLDAAFVIEKDPALTAKLLKIVNSAFYGFPSSIASVSRAITIVGTQEIQNLVLGAVIIDKFSAMPGVDFSMHDFWARSLKCALIARRIDAVTGARFKDEIFTCGLLHDIGQLVMFRRIPVLAREVLLMLQSQERMTLDDESKMEKAVIGFDHYETGAELCKSWKLPEIIIDSIKLHNYPDFTGPHCQIAAIIRLANYHSRLDIDHNAVISKSLGLSDQAVSMIVNDAMDQFEELFRIFYPSR